MPLPHGRGSVVVAFASFARPVPKGNFGASKKASKFPLTRFSKFPGAFRFANKNAFFEIKNGHVSIFVSRSFQFPPYMCKTGNFVPIATLARQPWPSEKFRSLTVAALLAAILSILPVRHSFRGVFSDGGSFRAAADSSCQKTGKEGSSSS